MFEWFEYPLMLLGLVLVPGYAALLYARGRRRAGPVLYARTALLRELMWTPRTLVARALPALRVLAIAALIVAAARPSVPGEDRVEVEGIDIYFVLDLSGSMRAIDLTDAQLRGYQGRGKEPPNRFVVAKETLADIVRARDVDRVGMVVFARDAFLQFPLTLDYGTILRQLDQLALGDIDGSGTAIGNAMGRAVAGLRNPDSDPYALETNERTRVLILITDGDRRGGNISPAEAARFAAVEGIRVFPILVGLENGKARVPMGRDLFSNRVTYRYQDYPVNPKLLQDIAEKTGGEFYRATDKKSLSKNLNKILDSFDRAPIEDAVHVSREQYYQPTLAFGVLLLLFELFLTYALVRPWP
jgi:Ca-activated chloride channel family protein